MRATKRLTAVLLVFVLISYVFADVSKALITDNGESACFEGFRYTADSPAYAGNTVITAVAYSKYANYYIENDIPLDGQTFSLPADFAGTVSGAPKNGASAVCDPDTDTIYIGNLYQLAATEADNRDELPVITGDHDPSTFGVGQFIFPNDAKEYLTYSAGHNYAVSTLFSLNRSAFPALRGRLCRRKLRS